MKHIDLRLAFRKREGVDLKSNLWEKSRYDIALKTALGR